MGIMASSSLKDYLLNYSVAILLQLNLLSHHYEHQEHIESYGQGACNFVNYKIQTWPTSTIKVTL